MSEMYVDMVYCATTTCFYSGQLHRIVLNAEERPKRLASSLKLANILEMYSALMTER